MNLTIAAFMAIGLHGHSQINKIIDTHEDQHAQGHLEMIQELVRYVAPAESMFNQMVAVCGAVPGVFDYEVSEIFGFGFGEYVLASGELYGAALEPVLLLDLARLTADFFSKFYSDGREARQARRVELFALLRGNLGLTKEAP
jgi:hypothetical protein